MPWMPAEFPIKMAPRSAVQCSYLDDILTWPNATVSNKPIHVAVNTAQVFTKTPHLCLFQHIPMCCLLYTPCGNGKQDTFWIPVKTPAEYVSLMP